VTNVATNTGRYTDADMVTHMVTKTDTPKGQLAAGEGANQCVSNASASEGGGTRTHDLGIKSPLLYQLSYAPVADETSSVGIAYTSQPDLQTVPFSGHWWQ
jgi:hypothetical protein